MLKLIPGTWTTGFFAPDGRWTPESDHASPEDAAKRVSFLNGAGRTQSLEGAQHE